MITRYTEIPSALILKDGEDIEPIKLSDKVYSPIIASYNLNINRVFPIYAIVSPILIMVNVALIPIHMPSPLSLDDQRPDGEHAELVNDHSLVSTVVNTPTVFSPITP